MIIIPRHNLYLPERKWGQRKFQRGILIATAIFGTAAADCTAGTSTIPNLNRLETSPTNAAVGARWDTTGNSNSYTNTFRDFPGVSRGTWIGSCANTEYDFRWVQTSGDLPSFSEGSDGAWVQASTQNISVEYEITGTGILFGIFTFELRRRSDLTVILTDGFTMDCEVESAGK